MEIPCKTLSTYASERLTEPGTFTVRARFSHVLNLSDGQCVLCVQDASIPQTPLSLVLEDAGFAAFRRLASDRAGLASGDGALENGAFKVTTSKARRFSCRMETCPVPGAEVCRRLRSGAALLTRPDSLAFAGDPKLAVWAGGTVTDTQHLARALLDEGLLWNLVGLGAGLTPAGDDFLVGLLAAYTAWGDQKSRQALADQIAPRLNRTTELSGAFLRAALAGEFSLPVLELFRALDKGAENLLTALAALCAIGHSSGSDLLGGILYGLQEHFTWEGIS